MSKEVAEFTRAIRNLQTFTEINEGESFPLISDLEVQGMEIVQPKRPRRIEMANLIFAFTMNDNSPQKEVLNVLKESSEVVGKYSNLLVQYENGSSEQKSFAERANKVITRFNQLIDQATRIPKKLSERIARKMYESCGLFSAKNLYKIELPQKFRIKVPSFEADAAPLFERKITTAEDSDTLKKVSSLTAQVKTDLSRQTLDMYLMKAIRLLETQGLCNGQDARTAVNKYPIETKCHEEFCEITQCFPTLDNHTYRIHCVFSRDNPSGDYRRLVSCSINLEN